MKLKLLLLLIILVLPLLGWRLSLFTIKRIDCQLNHYPCPLNLEPKLLNFIGQNIFSFNQSAAVTELINFDPTLTDIGIRKHLPDQLRLNLVRRIPTAVIKNVAQTDSSQWQEIDKTGFVFSPLKNSDQSLPEVRWPEEIVLPQGESPLSLNLAKLINTLAAYYVNFEHLTRLAEPVYLIVTTAGPEAVIAADTDFAPRIASLQFILSNIKIGETMPTKIDLRFDKPTLTY